MWVISRLHPRPVTLKMYLALGEISSMIGKWIILGRDKPLSPSPSPLIICKFTPQALSSQETHSP